MRAAFVYKNRKGVAYYLRETLTKAGKPRYCFARTSSATDLQRMPEGYTAAHN